MSSRFILNLQPSNGYGLPLKMSCFFCPFRPHHEFPTHNPSYYFAISGKSMPIQTTDRISLAAQFVNSTDSHIFLTGKAGTGKTTFLHNLAAATHKKFLIVAPTGIAALNAGGVTIHSQFLLPFGMFHPDQTSWNGVEPKGPFYTPHALARKHPLNSLRKQVLRDIDLLVIDEVSMLRADLLDAIDYRMKSVKGNFRRSFGGVQLLMVGDLYQLPPIVKDHEWGILREHYKSAHFFESQALKRDGFTYIELDKIFRQQDDKFIHILNNLRNNVCTEQDLLELNTHYKEEELENKEETITITTHNNLADRLNQKALQNLSSKSFFYKAKIDGDFPERLYPIPETMELKEGAQVMFVKNDTQEKRYFNGKLATISKLNKNNISVIMAGEKEEYSIEPYTWENKKYSINSQKELEEDIVGTFIQFPIKLAWAITVHKSQGLTFESAIIDVGRAFAPGQVYVALSRLRSLNGLTLRTKIHESVISSDEEVVRFTGSKEEQEPLHQSLKQRQAIYLRNLLLQCFDYSEIIKQIEYIQDKAGQKIEFEDPEMQHALNNLNGKFIGESKNTRRFQNQIKELLSTSNGNKLQERIKKGSDYYLNFLYSCLKDLLLHLEETEQFSRIKTYQNALAELDQMINKNISALQKATYITQCIFNEQEITRNEGLIEERRKKRQEIRAEITEHIKANPKNSSTKTGRKRKKGKEKGATFQETFKLVKKGLNIEEIAKERALVVGTIESHFSRGIASGDLQILELMDEEELKEIEVLFPEETQKPLSEIYNAANGKYSYGKLRMVQAHLDRKKEDKGLKTGV